MCSSATPTRPSWPPSAPAGCASRGRTEASRSRCPRPRRTTCRRGWTARSCSPSGPGTLAAAAAHLAGRLRRRRVRRPAAPRPGRRGRARPSAVGPGAGRGGVGRLRRRLNSGPGWCGVGDRATLLVGELDGLHTERAGLLASHIPGAQLTGRILGCLQSGLAQDARPGGHRPRRPAGRRGPGRSAVPAAAARGGAGGAGRGGGAARPGRRLRPRRPARLARPARAGQPGGRRTRTPRSTWTWRCGTGRPTCPPFSPNAAAPLVRRLAELLRAIEQGRRSCSPSNLDLLAAHERLERLGRPLERGLLGDRRAGPGPAPGRWPGARSASRTSSRWPACRPAAAARPAIPGPAAADAVLVRRLREAGAEVFATTQCLEYAAGFAHPEVGDTRNPRDPSRTSGGSSGGSAALVAAGVCDLAARHRHRRFGPDPGRLLRGRRAQAELRAPPAGRGLPALAQLRPRGHAHRHRGRRR